MGLALTLTLTFGAIFISSYQILEAEASTSISLFNVSGQMTRVQAQNILDALGDTPAVNTSIDRNMKFRLFPQVTLPSNHANNLMSLNWRITQTNGDRVTFWAVDGYRTSVFNTAAVGSPSSDYSVSILRENLLNDYAYIAARFPTLLDSILTKNTTSENAVVADRIWIPSVLEVGIGGVWAMTPSLRSFDAFHGNDNAWLRTAATANLAYFLTADGSVENASLVPLSNQLVVRPALHISLAAIQEAAESGAGGGAIVPPGNNVSDNVRTARIVGGILGGLFFILLVAVMFKYLFGRRRR